MAVNLENIGQDSCSRLAVTSVEVQARAARVSSLCHSTIDTRKGGARTVQD